MKYGSKALYTYHPACHTEDGRDQADLMRHAGQVTVLRYYDDYRLVLVHDARGRKFYADKAELTPVPQTQTPAGMQEEMFNE